MEIELAENPKIDQKIMENYLYIPKGFFPGFDGGYVREDQFDNLTTEEYKAMVSALYPFQMSEENLSGAKQLLHRIANAARSELGQLVGGMVSDLIIMIDNQVNPEIILKQIQRLQRELAISKTVEISEEDFEGLSKGAFGWIKSLVGLTPKGEERRDKRRLEKAGGALPNLIPNSSQPSDVQVPYAPGKQPPVIPNWLMGGVTGALAPIPGTYTLPENQSKPIKWGTILLVGGGVVAVLTTIYLITKKK